MMLSRSSSATSSSYTGAQSAAQDGVQSHLTHCTLLVQQVSHIEAPQTCVEGSAANTGALFHPTRLHDSFQPDVLSGVVASHVQIMIDKEVAEAVGGLKKLVPTGTCVLIEGQLAETPEGTKQVGSKANMLVHLWFPALDPRSKASPCRRSLTCGSQPETTIRLLYIRCRSRL